MHFYAQLALVPQSTISPFACLLLACGGILAVALIFTGIYLKLVKKAAKWKKQTERQDIDISSKFNALIKSLDDIIFEFNEDKICLNVWFNDTQPRPLDPHVVIGKTLDEVIGPEKAKKYNEALDHVIKTRTSIIINHPSDFGTGKWFEVKMTPVFDNDGNYSKVITTRMTDVTDKKLYAEALKENELLLKEAQIIAKTGNWWYDHDTRETHWADNLYALLEVDSIPPQFGSKLDYYTSLVHPADREETFQYFRSLHKPGAAEFHEHKLITPGGKLKYIKALKGNSLVYKAGDLGKISGVIQDVTESKLIEKAIKLSRTELVEAQTIAKIGNWKWDTDKKLISWSDEIKRIAELNQTEATEYGIMKLMVRHVNADDRAIIKGFLKNILTINNSSLVVSVVTPSKKTKYFSFIVGKMLKREDGSARKVIGTLQDITERRQAEIAYTKTEDKYKLVLETANLAALSIDKNGYVSYCNQYLAALMGYDQREITGKRWTTFVPESHARVIEGWYQQQNVLPRYVNPVICRNGEQRIISWQNTVSYSESGEVEETTAIGEDITDQQKATEALINAKETAEKSSEFKSEFLSIMSHEIRTPMNAVIGTTNLLISDDPKPEQLEYLNILKFSADNLLAIINDILDYNKIEAGKLELNIQRFNLHELCQKIRKSFAPKALEKLLEIDLTIVPGVPEFVMGDQMRLSQILNNLVGNAVKFTQKGRVKLSLENEADNGNSAIIKFVIADTGIGISAANLKAIFDPFMQESQFINNNSGGTGLGLAITKRLVDLHHSSIQVDSEIGVGTTFTFSLQFEVPEEKSRQQSKSDSLSINLYGMNILLVDDNELNLMIASAFLKKWQATVEEAKNGLIAVNMVETKPYDVIIMDLQMPVMDGFEATKAIKALRPEIPVIALTADAMPETQQKALDYGMNDYLTKPFVPGVLYEKLAKYYRVS